MKKIISLLFLFVLISANQANARARIPIGKMEKISLVHDLPNNENYSLENDHFLDLGQFYEVFTVVFIPIWVTKEPTLVGYDKESEMYYDLTEEQLNGILEDNNLKKENLLGVGFWNKYGGKLIILLILGVAGYFMYGRGGNEEEE